jgi:hypothetical protein
MIFKLTANTEFEADSIDDAFAVLAEHFKQLVEDENYHSSPFIGGEIRIENLSTGTVRIDTGSE